MWILWWCFVHLIVSTQASAAFQDLETHQNFLGEASPSQSLSLDDPRSSFLWEWQVLAPFQIGTREIAWGGDPLEFHGGFHNLKYDKHATFRSSLGHNGTVSWFKQPSKVRASTDGIEASLSVNYTGIDLRLLSAAYGWLALQWQGWARGRIYVPGNKPQKYALSFFQVIEYWVDDQHFFGGDFYGFGRASVVLTLEPGIHIIELRLARDVRSEGGVGPPSIDIKLSLDRLDNNPASLSLSNAILPDVVQGALGNFASVYGSVTVRNDGDTEVRIVNIEGLYMPCEFDLLADGLLTLLPGQSRPVGFRVSCVVHIPQLNFVLSYKEKGSNQRIEVEYGHDINIIEGKESPHKITFLHPGGFVSYAILRPPPISKRQGCAYRRSAPVVVALHGAGVEGDSEMVKHSLDSLWDTCAWTVFPSGVTPWSGDDWHQWGFSDIEAAVNATATWVKQVDWEGPLPKTDKWILVGHSNGGQGVWYALTHRPDKIAAAAALSGYSSIETYVPYSFWRISEPAREAVLHEALLSYRHELLLENVKGIPIYQQHGSEDDNVPSYHSGLLGQRLQEAGGQSTYFEISGEPHWWDGVMATESFESFVRRQINEESDKEKGHFGRQSVLTNFSLTVANPGDSGNRYGVEILQLSTPGLLARIDFTFSGIPAACFLDIRNVQLCRIPEPFWQECELIYVNGVPLEAPNPSAINGHILKSTPSGVVIDGDIQAHASAYRGRQLRQQHGLEAILQTHGAFQIVTHSRGTEKIALQISRNLNQYFGADTVITTSYEQAQEATGNVISLAIGDDLPPSKRHRFPISHKSDSMTLSNRPGDYWATYTATEHGLAAIYVRPLKLMDDRLELVVWGADLDSLAVAARLVPMMTGTGQPDFVVMDRQMLWKGLDGAMALGWFKYLWDIARTSVVS